MQVNRHFVNKLPHSPHWYSREPAMSPHQYRESDAFPPLEGRSWQTTEIQISHRTARRTDIWPARAAPHSLPLMLRSRHHSSLASSVPKICGWVRKCEGGHDGGGTTGQTPVPLSFHHGRWNGNLATCSRVQVNKVSRIRYRYRPVRHHGQPERWASVLSPSPFIRHRKAALT